MNKINKIVLGLLTCIGIVSCDNYLDVVPDNVPTIEHAFRSRNEAEKYLFTCYSYRPEIGSVNQDPAMTSDEIFKRYYIAASSEDWNNFKIALGFQSVNNPILNMWNGENGSESSFRAIRDCNIFLENVDIVPDYKPGEKTRVIAEVKFLKAYYHYQLLKCYGPIPIIDKNLPIDASPEEVKVYREPIDDVVKYISNLMAEAALTLPDAADVKEATEAGRVDKLAALSIRAELLVYAASPLFNGNKDYASMIDNKGRVLFPQTYDANKWQVAADACREAIDACVAQGKALYSTVDPAVIGADPVFQLQTTYRQAICDRWNNELIWGNTRYNNRDLQQHCQARIMRLQNALPFASSEYAPTLKMVEKYYTSNGVPMDEDKDWQANQWYQNRYQIRATPSAEGEEEKLVEKGRYTVNLHFNREPRFYASIGFDQGVYFGNQNYIFSGPGRNVKFTEFLKGGITGYQGGSGYSATGYAAKKLASFKNAQTPDQTSEEFYPFPIMRLADLYLLYAEASNEVMGGSPEAIRYLDLIRARVGLKGVIESWADHSTNPDKPTTQDGLRAIIQQERSIELAFEGKRFWDIRRWKKINEMNIQPKGWNIQGSTKEDFYNVTTLPKVPISFSKRDYFWPIKQYDLIVNPNLVQNYGW